MPSPRTPRVIRRALALSGAAALAAALIVSARPAPVQVDNRLVATKYPTNAAKVFRWGNAQWDDDFVGPMWKAWRTNRPAQVEIKNGMLILNGGSHGSVAATVDGHGRRYGRWETRIMSQQYTNAHTPYQVVGELIPAGGRDFHCGARSIVLSSYRPGAARASTYIRNLPRVQHSYSKALNLGSEQWHTYAVEVTKTHISWFVDTHVLMTERRSSARSGAMFDFRFRLVAQSGKQMNPGRMQMDWLRYYTLERPNAKSIKAPMSRRGTFASAC